jgi:hypothetical protein
MAHPWARSQGTGLSAHLKNTSTFLFEGNNLLPTSITNLQLWLCPGCWITLAQGKDLVRGEPKAEAEEGGHISGFRCDLPEQAIEIPQILECQDLPGLSVSFLPWDRPGSPKAPVKTMCFSLSFTWAQRRTWSES